MEWSEETSSVRSVGCPCGRIESSVRVTKKVKSGCG